MNKEDFYRAYVGTHLDRYGHCPAIAFQSGADDRQVPPDGGQRFVQALAKLYARRPERLQVNLRPNTPHRFTPEMWEASLKWFQRWLGGGGDRRAIAN